MQEFYQKSFKKPQKSVYKKFIYTAVIYLYIMNYKESDGNGFFHQTFWFCVNLGGDNLLQSLTKHLIINTLVN